MAMFYRYSKYMGYDVSIVESGYDAFVDVSNVSAYAQDAMRWACGTKLVNGSVDADGIKKLNPCSNARRSEISAILMRFCEDIAVTQQPAQ